MNLHVVKENMLAFIIALVLSLFLVLMIYKAEFLKGDIMGVPNQAGADVQGDISYSVKDGKLAITSNKDLKGLSSMNLTLLFDPSKVTIDSKDIKSDYQLSSNSKTNDGKIDVIISISELKVGTNILNVNFNGDNTTINVSDIGIVFTDGKSENLSVSSK